MRTEPCRMATDDLRIPPPPLRANGLPLHRCFPGRVQEVGLPASLTLLISWGVAQLALLYVI